ncbi:hypothetical protein RN001_013744 [Aquatica leii]|uniref:VWFC domain-containing protein n=1 Tax=Aquatica leii TaxID=1421715 RepID=A0AAN7PR06_9COLE|nr:hypothetical protein RN001_013744 [Aquatica leii]
MKLKFTFLINVLVCVVQILGKCPEDCEQPNFLYESFQCTPNCVDTDDCPISYDCSSISQHSDMCFYNGQHYKPGESVRNNITWEQCLGCSCAKDTDTTTKFYCYSGSCARPLSIEEGCVIKQILGECCSVDIICPPFSECLVEGETFKEENGKFYHPKDRCTKCVCERGDGVEGITKCQKQYCSDLLRSQQEIKQMCAPFYEDAQHDCCPSRWICPEENITFDELGQENDGPTCLFGDKVLQKKQKFYVDRVTRKIVCVVQILGKCPDDCEQPNFLYESFQCTPNCIDTDDCPVSYDCSSINQHSDMCFYNGQHYNVGESVSTNLTWEHCLGCKCIQDTETETKFLCYSGSCQHPITNDNCVVKQILGECCSGETICPPFRKCLVEDKIFQEENGKFYHPKNKCTKCVCERGDGDEGITKCQIQYCDDLLLSQQNIRRMCAPFYYIQDDCCPSQWICPEEKVTFDEPPQESEGSTCLFGDKTLQKTQKFYVDRETTKIVCECKLPPFATCFALENN